MRKVDSFVATVGATVGLALGVALATTDLDPGSGYQPTPSPLAYGPPEQVFPGHPEAVNNGAYIDYRIASGVDCPPRYPAGFGLSASNELEVDPELQVVTSFGYNFDGFKPAVFVGEDTAPDYQGYYALKNAWALLFNQSQQTYEFDQVFVEGVGQPDKQHYYRQVQVIGQRLLTLTPLDMEFGGTGTWNDGRTNVNISVDRQAGIQSSWSELTFLPPIKLDVWCV